MSGGPDTRRSCPGLRDFPSTGEKGYARDPMSTRPAAPLSAPSSPRAPRLAAVPGAPAALSERWLAVLLLATALVPRLVVFPLNQNLYGDAVIRTELAQRWLAAPHLITSYADGAFQFGPLHLYLLAFVLKLGVAKEH